MKDKNSLEAVLYSEGGDISLRRVHDILGLNELDVREIAEEYNRLDRGTVIIVGSNSVSMRVAKKYAPLVEKIRKKENERSLSKSAVEVLAIVLYSPGRSVTAQEIEHVRGVNSAYTLRQLLIKGFLTTRRDGARYVYEPTAELLAFLGVSSKEELPEFDNTQKRIKKFLEYEMEK